MTSVYLFAICLLTLSVTALKLPSYTPACSRNDPKIDECVIRNGQAAIPMFINGDPKYRVPKLDPLTINELRINQGTKQIGLKLNLKNCKIFGLGSAKFVASRTDLKKKHIEWDFNIPSIQIIGKYNISGQVLILPITGSGEANITITELKITYNYDWTLVTKSNGKEYMNFTHSELHFDNGRAYFMLSNLFNGDRLLGDNMNYFLNENWREVTKELGPAVGEAIGEVFRLLLTNIAELVPYDYIYPDIPV